jgi:hypothetical protein
VRKEGFDKNKREEDNNHCRLRKTILEINKNIVWTN